MTAWFGRRPRVPDTIACEVAGFNVRSPALPAGPDYARLLLGKSIVFADTRQTIDKCRRARHRKLIRNSAHAPRAGFSDVLAECGLRRRERTKRAKIGGRTRTLVETIFQESGARFFVVANRRVALECRHGTRRRAAGAGFFWCPAVCDDSLEPGVGRRSTQLAPIVRRVSHALRELLVPALCVCASAGHDTDEAQDLTQAFFARL